MQSRCIVVLGSHRSGTSLVANILQALGVNMGERFREADEFNPDGYCEDLDFKELNQSILKTAGGTWHEPPTMDALACAPPNFLVRINDLAVVKSKSPVWGFKDPRTCLTYDCLRLWLRKYCDVRLVVVIRNIDNIVDSIMHREAVRKRRDDRPRMYWKLLVQYYDLLAKVHSSNSRWCVVSYDDLVDDHRVDITLRRLAMLAFSDVFEQVDIGNAKSLIRFREDK